MILYDYKANGHGPDEFYSYEGDIHSIQKLSKHGVTKVHGWLIESRTIFLKKFRVVLFVKDKQIYLHSEDRIWNLSQNDVAVSYRKYLNFSIVKIIAEENQKKTYAIQTPIVRFLNNDGMFPKEVEPFLDVIDRLTDKDERERLTNILMKGIDVEAESALM